MKKILIAAAILIVLLCGCSNAAEAPAKAAEDRIRVPAGSAYYMRLTGEEERGENIVPQGIVLGEDNELNFEAGVTAGADKERMALQVLIDYKQVPLIVDGETYDTYYMEAQDNIPIAKKIKLAADIDRSVDHKITALLLYGLQVPAADADSYTMDNAVAMDELLICDEKKDNLIRSDAAYETDYREYEEISGGIFLTLEEDEDKRAIPGSVIHAKPGENVQVYYHLSGFTQSGETLVFLNIGEKQANINGKDFLLFWEDCADRVLYGKLEMTAPTEEGKYEVSAWAVSNPYSGSVEGSMIGGSPRFTLCVEK